MRKTHKRISAVLLTALILFSIQPVSVLADEGMFLPDAISSLPLEKRGLKLKPSDIYNPEGVSLKDAVVIVGGGTGEFVSPDGLLLTNHHVAFEALVSASSAGKDYGTAGFLAHTRAEELPAKDYTVTITQDLKDVTSEVLKGITDTTPQLERAAAIQTAIKRLEGASNKAEGIQVRVLPLNEGLRYYQFTYLVIPDVRIAYAPPKSIGYFGGDDDNFEWPRHCGDFTFMRAYVGPDGKPAAYSPNNVPYKPKKFLTVSMEGLKEGEFTMILGYPGSTRRYRESYSVAYNQDVFMPFYIDIYGTRIELLKDAQRESEELRVRLQSDIFGLSNTLKDFEGSVLAMRRDDVVQKKREQEAAFTRYIDADAARKARYGDILPTLAKSYQELNATAQHDLLVQQLAGATSLIEYADAATTLAEDREKPEAQRNPAFGPEFTKQIRENLPAVFSQRVPSVDRRFLLYLFRKAAELPQGQKIEFLEQKFGGLEPDARRRAEEEYSNQIADSPRFPSAEKFGELFEMKLVDIRALNDPLIDFAVAMTAELRKSTPRTQQFNATVSRLRPLLIQGMSEMNKTVPYPDANRTLRFTYGNVKSYVPRQAIYYEAFTSLAGVLEKDTGREPFNVPARLKELFKARDLGPYGQKGDVPVDFLATTDIIGGNSGSPVMNARGEQVGIAFDSNYEGLGNDFFFSNEKGRTISVDIRYVLFVADKFGGAGYLFNEMNIKGRNRK